MDTGRRRMDMALSPAANGPRGPGQGLPGHVAISENRRHLKRRGRRQANIMGAPRKLQRAWLVAGMGPTHSPQMDDEGQPKFGPNGRPMVCCQPNFHKYGNPPAFVQYLDWGFCSDPPPVQPDWRACTRTLINNWADTSGAAKPIEVSPAHELMENPVSPRL